MLVLSPHSMKAKGGVSWASVWHLPSSAFACLCGDQLTLPIKNYKVLVDFSLSVATFLLSLELHKPKYDNQILIMELNLWRNS